jgi:glucokinase
MTSPATSRKFTIGIDLGGTSVRLGLYDTAAMQTTLLPIDSQSYRTRVEDGPAAVIADMAESVQTMVAGLPAGSSCSGIGIGSPGPLNLQLGTLGKLPNFPGWDYFPLRDSLAEATGLPVFLECDANAAAVAEWKLGAGRAAMLDSLAMFTLGTGVGGGIILNGQVWHGIVGMGGELGHVSLDRNGPPCGCGARGCLEQYASANGLLRIAREHASRGDASSGLKALTSKLGGFTPREVATLAESGDTPALQCFEELGFYLGFGIASLINTLDLPLIVVGGGVASAWNLFSPKMFESVREYSYVYRLGEPTQRETMEKDRTFIRPAALGPAAGLLGAALLPQLSQPEHQS